VFFSFNANFTLILPQSYTAAQETDEAEAEEDCKDCKDDFTCKECKEFEEEAKAAGVFVTLSKGIKYI